MTTLMRLFGWIRDRYRRRNSIPYVCHECKVEGVKLWRQYNAFVVAITLMCKRCAERDQGEDPVDLNETDCIRWMVPAVPAPGEDGPNSTFWGYTSVPQDRVDWWKGLPSC